jgi:hypothetical protein
MLFFGLNNNIVNGICAREGSETVRFPFAEILKPQGFKAERAQRASSKNPTVG